MNRTSLELTSNSSTVQEWIIQSMRGQGLPGLTPIKNPFVSILQIKSGDDFWVALVYLGVFYDFTYFAIAGVLEYTNPFPKNSARIASIKREMLFGLSALFFVIVYATLWMWKVDPYTPYYGYWEGRENEFTLWQMIKQILIYMVLFDLWFYSTHQFLHIDWFMRNIHKYHHSFYEPSAFAQDAVHPLEAILQGPMGHFGITLIYPMNPLLITLLGFLTSVYAQCAHDSRSLDFNDHVKHHHYRNCNFGLYWGLFDYVFGTRYSPQKYPVKFVPSYIIQQAKKEQDLKKND